MKTLSRSCRGNIEYHSVLAIVRKWMADANCNGSYHRTRQGVKSGIEYKRRQELRTKPHESKRLRRCLNEVHNFTFDHENYLLRLEKINQNRRLRQQMASSLEAPVIEEDAVPPASSPLLLPVPSRRSMPRTKRNHEDPPVEEDCMVGDDATAESPMAPDFVSLYEKDDEPLMCSLFGDPHVRTFDNSFQTCRCLGAWPMIEHPMFAVQVTNSRANEAVHLVSGINKVTILIREFPVCGVESNLIYEADLQDELLLKTDGSGERAMDLPTTFTDGTTATSNSLVKITARSGGHVCVQMDHVMAQVCVYRVPFTSYLNVIVKFKRQMNSEEREAMIDAMDPATLCTGGCPEREAIRVEEVLDAIGVDVQDSGVDECEGLFGYYFVFCLFDVKMKGIRMNETFVHRLAQDMDDILVVKRSFARSHVGSLLQSNSGSRQGQQPRSLDQLLTLLVTIFTAATASAFSR